MRDTEGDEAARYGAPARRRPRDPETDISINEVETKRRRLGGLRESDRFSPPNASQYSSIEKNESIRGVPIGESRAYYKPGIHTPYLLTTEICPCLQIHRYLYLISRAPCNHRLLAEVIAAAQGWPRFKYPPGLIWCFRICRRYPEQQILLCPRHLQLNIHRNLEPPTSQHKYS